MGRLARGQPARTTVTEARRILDDLVAMLVSHKHDCWQCSRPLARAADRCDTGWDLAVRHARASARVRQLADQAEREGIQEELF